MPFVPIQSQGLRQGLYIKIEGSWFSHPFPTNTFKIKTAKELSTLRRLTKVTFFVDPDRSDPEPTNSKTHQGSLAEQHQDGDTTTPGGPEVSGNPGRSQSKIDMPDDEALRHKVEQRQAVQAYKAHLDKVGRRFHEVVQESKQIVQDVISGRSRGLRTAQKIVGNLYEMLSGVDDSRAFLNLIGSDTSNEEFFVHALNVCSLSLMVGQDLGLPRAAIEILALGAMFHDVGELKYPAELLLRKGSMSPSELKDFLSTHPKRGEEMMEKLPNFPYEALEVIRDHHERLNGSGHPAGKKGEHISTFTRIVMVVDEYDGLCHHPNPAHCLIPSEALSHLYVKCRHTLWHDAVVSLIRQLGVYPPGSLVRLSNQKTGLVTSVNLANRLRPIILAYDEQASEEPLVLNLAEEDDTLNILHAIRPIDLSPVIRECLNPRRMISYFPSVVPADPGGDADSSFSGPSASFAKA